jgi:phosphoglycolate phosphatase-like HAD superfamily hydrolase
LAFKGIIPISVLTNLKALNCFGSDSQLSATHLVKIMLPSTPNILALDFDGVVCDGLIEYFQTAWRSYCQIWHPVNLTPPENLSSHFYRFRPVVESGWEMPIVLRALILGVPEEKIWTNWQGVTAEILREDNLQAAAIGAQVDQIRDEWIAADLEGWLGQHRFYPGIVARLQKLVNEPVEIKIVTTKEGRFVRQLLQQQGISLPDEAILGKEVKRPKHQTLRELLGASVEHSPRIWFVEDRLKTLQAVSEYPDLAEVQLYLADWGYNTAEMRESVKGDRRIHLLSLSQFAQDFTAWGK